MLKEFKEFAIKGSVMDMAVGIIIGAAFQKIVSSLVADVIMPTIGLLLGRLNFSTLALTIGNSTISYGMFIQSVVDFVVVAFVIFLVIRQINRFKRKSADAPKDEKPENIQLLIEIRDLLKK